MIGLKICTYDVAVRIYQKYKKHLANSIYQIAISMSPRPSIVFDRGNVFFFISETLIQSAFRKININ